jgi:hypothetical protein
MGTNCGKSALARTALIVSLLAAPLGCTGLSKWRAERQGQAALDQIKLKDPEAMPEGNDQEPAFGPSEGQERIPVRRPVVQNRGEAHQEDAIEAFRDGVRKHEAPHDSLDESQR